ncbi:MAG: U32 family peptidase [Pirellulales bacterium]
MRQACRLPYELVVDGQTRDFGDRAYMLSPLDLAAPELIKSLLEAGVVSFKIEGRLKTSHYVAATSQVYRAALDQALAGRATNYPAPPRSTCSKVFHGASRKGSSAG